MVIRLHMVTCHLYLVYLINSFSLEPGAECPVASFIGLYLLYPQDSHWNHTCDSHKVQM